MSCNPRALYFVTTGKANSGKRFIYIQKVRVRKIKQKGENMLFGLFK
jgi:hypothetical protein